MCVVFDVHNFHYANDNDATLARSFIFPTTNDCDPRDFARVPTVFVDAGSDALKFLFIMRKFESIYLSSDVDAL